MADLTVIKGKYGYNINLTIQNADASVFVLTGYTITFKQWVEHSPGNLLLSGACTIDVAASGTCHYAVVAGNFGRAGIFKGIIELTKSGIEDATDTFDIEVKESG